MTQGEGNHQGFSCPGVSGGKSGVEVFILPPPVAAWWGSGAGGQDIRRSGTRSLAPETLSHELWLGNSTTMQGKKIKFFRAPARRVYVS
jgi:hypothetical protein